MSFTLEKFVAVRPYLYHLTDKRNVDRIRDTGRLCSATYLLKIAKELKFIDSRRPESISISNDGHEIWVRDQAPLHEGNIGFEDGATFEDVIKMINDKVFFWPGRSTGPIPSGLRHFARYEFERPVVLRLDTSRLFSANKASPLFCRYNSGSPRWSRGIPSPRGPSTFIDCANAQFSATMAIECVFREQIILPDCTKIASGYAGPWKGLF